ncbi:MAG: hypothetical protein HXY40_09805 [Chloroflexi bacterium]|nr:hypothetical protein [Chloroflexota bacterium]
MKLSRAGRALLILIVVLVVFGVLYAALILPDMLHWGATMEEINAPLIGDDILADANYESTRAITINAPASDVWPWVAQLGQGRGGMYSYEVLENLFGCNSQNATQILSEFQTLNIGDSFSMCASRPPFTVVAIEPNAAFVVQSADNTHTWSWIVQSIDDGTSRVITRMRAVVGPTLGEQLNEAIVLDPVQFLMETKTLLGIKERAEGTIGGSALDTLEVLLWFVAVLLTALALAAALVGRDWWPPLAVGLLAVVALWFLLEARALLPQGLLLIALIFVGLLWGLSKRTLPRQPAAG